MVIVTPFQQKKKQRYLFLVLGIVIFGMIFALWYRSSQRAPSSPRVLPQKPPEININFDILKSPILTELRPFTDITPFKGEVGRENPFRLY